MPLLVLCTEIILHFNHCSLLQHHVLLYEGVLLFACTDVSTLSPLFIAWPFLDHFLSLICPLSMRLMKHLHENLYFYLVLKNLFAESPCEQEGVVCDQVTNNGLSCLLELSFCFAVLGGLLCSLLPAVGVKEYLDIVAISLSAFINSLVELWPTN